jgi:polyphosphate:AMP phosphotransferase
VFEAVALGRKASKAEVAAAEPELQNELLSLQRRLTEADFPVIIIVAGVEGAGKGEVVNRLLKWFDARGVETHAFWDETEEERSRPRFWRFWRALPPKGKIGIMFGSWYTQPIINQVIGKTNLELFDREIHRINEFEQAQTDDGVLIIKLWFHLSQDEQHRRIQREKKGKREKISPLTKKFAKHYSEFAAVSERAIRLTDKNHCPWHLIESDDRNYRNLAVGKIVGSALRQRLDEPTVAPSAGPGRTPVVQETTVLDKVAVEHGGDEKTYRAEIKELQHELYGLGWEARNRRVNTVAVFEGWDAAGKGGAIRRVTEAMDARLYRVISVAAPTDEERAHHYLWRFWRHLPRAGYCTIYDRSWYGRVLVERVEEFAQPAEWQRGYQEINAFEEQLVEHGTVLFKFWLHIDREEQHRRFKEREVTAHKQHKITDEDWRNRERWSDYEQAVNDMVARTSTEYAPWTLVAGNDKLYARLQVLRVFRDGLKRALKNLD